MYRTLRRRGGYNLDLRTSRPKGGGERINELLLWDVAEGKVLERVLVHRSQITRAGKQLLAKYAGEGG